MKKIALFILAVAALCSCSKDETVTNQPTDGQYIYESGSFTVSISVDGAYTGITIFENSCYVYQSLYNYISGSWPTYGYEYSGNHDELIILECRYSDSTVFTATVKNNGTGISLPSTMRFELDNRTLDANGDGILDSAQPDLFSE